MTIRELQCLVSHTICVNFMDRTFVARTENQLEFLSYSGMEFYLRSVIAGLHITATNNIRTSVTMFPPK